MDCLAGVQILPAAVRKINMLRLWHFREPLDMCHLWVCGLWEVRLVFSSALFSARGPEQFSLSDPFYCALFTSLSGFWSHRFKVRSYSLACRFLDALDHFF